MSGAHVISLTNLALIGLPIFAVIGVMYHWGIKIRSIIIATVRMLAQLLTIGFCLTYIFQVNIPWVNYLVLSFMAMMASIISLRTSSDKTSKMFYLSVVSLTISGLPILMLVILLILESSFSSSPKILIPITGMILSNSMNALAIGNERFENDISLGVPLADARNKALQTALIPMTNAFLAVGLVSLPGMMTGQILAGTDPLIAVRYQIVVMGMTFGSSGLGTAIFLGIRSRLLSKSQLNKIERQSSCS